MKLFLLLALAVVGMTAAVPTELDITDTEENQEVAELSGGSRVLVRRKFFSSGESNTVRISNYTYRGRGNIRITNWRVTRVGSDEGATATRTGGGVGNNFLSIRFQSVRGRGFSYMLEIYGC